MRTREERLGKKLISGSLLLRQKRMIRVTETKRMMATNKPGVVQMKGGAYVILIMLIYRYESKNCNRQFLYPVNLKPKVEVLLLRSSSKVCFFQ